MTHLGDDVRRLLTEPAMAHLATIMPDGSRLGRVGHRVLGAAFG
jgi:hypothetical protein